MPATDPDGGGARRSPFDFLCREMPASADLGEIGSLLGEFQAGSS
jgi:hypothetical protein